MLAYSLNHLSVTEVQYLGHVVSQAGIRPDDDKVKAVSTYPVLRTTKGLKQFLGLTNYYRQFIKDYAHIIEPLTQSPGEVEAITTVGCILSASL